MNRDTKHCPRIWRRLKLQIIRGCTKTARVSLHEFGVRDSWCPSPLLVSLGHSQVCPPSPSTPSNAPAAHSASHSACYRGRTRGLEFCLSRPVRRRVSLATHPAPAAAASAPPARPTTDSGSQTRPVRVPLPATPEPRPIAELPGLWHPVAMDTFTTDAFDVPDSTDWLATPLAGLMPVEQAFRCHVCKDFYNSPMLTSCNHTFCSICIRRCLSVDGKCPLCRAGDQESKLRGNWALREAVDAFVRARDGILAFARTPAPAPAPALAPISSTPAPGSPKRKAAAMHETAADEQEHKRPRMSTRSSKARAAEATAAMMREEADMVPEPAYNSMPIYEHYQEQAYEPEPSTSVSFPAVKDATKVLTTCKDDGLVACPICLTRMKPWQVDRHIDTSCPGTPQPQPRPQPVAATSSRETRGHGGFASPYAAFEPPTPAKAPERLPPLAYSMLKDIALRKKMTELGISASGSRQMLERRHQEWITIWNANCDSARPKKRSDLLHDLDVWERTVGSRAPTMSRAVHVGAQIKDKDFDGAAWAASHNDSFKDLIANARKSRKLAEQQAPEGSETAKKEENGEEPAKMVEAEAELPPPQPPIEPSEPSEPPRTTMVNLTEPPPSSQPEPGDMPIRPVEPNKPADRPLWEIEHIWAD